MAIVLATADEPSRAETVGLLAREGLPVRSVASWEALCHAVADPGTRLVLVDPRLSGLDPALLRALGQSLAHRPRLRTLGEARPPLERIPHTPRAILTLARTTLGPGALGAAGRRDLRWYGLGDDPLPQLVRLVMARSPVLVMGERGTGKERLARTLHALAYSFRSAEEGGPAPFVSLPAGVRWERSPGPGTLYIEAAHRRDAAEVRALVRDATGLRWRVTAGSRAGEAPVGVGWAELRIPPLRERPNDLDALAQHYADLHAARLGLGRRRLDRSLLAAMHAWRWPGNQRELEDFVVAALQELPGTTLRAADMPDGLAARLRPPAEVTSQHVGGFEEMAEERLRPVVAAYAPGGDVTLHELVIASTERVLLTLALARTGGNRRAAAELLGLARNTLQARLRDLRISASKE